MMVSKKGTRRLEYEGTTFYWYVRRDAYGIVIHILSEDKKIHLECPHFDSEVPVTTKEIKGILKDYYGKK